MLKGYVPRGRASQLPPPEAAAAAAAVAERIGRRDDDVGLALPLPGAPEHMLKRSSYKSYG